MAKLQILQGPLLTGELVGNKGIYCIGKIYGLHSHIPH